LLTSIGGWHVVTRIVGVVQAMEDTPSDARTRALEVYQGPGFRVTWSKDSILPEGRLRWQGRLISEALQSQLGSIDSQGVRVGEGILALPHEMGLGRGSLNGSMTGPMTGPMSGPMNAIHDRRLRMMHGDDAFKHQTMMISVRLSDGSWLNFATPPAPRPSLWRLRFFWLGVMGLLIVIAASIWAVRRATQPLNLFAQAAERLGVDFNAPPMAETGPREVRGAAKAFNVMQHRLQTFVNNRTHMLAAISHDLRTPITRLRLRAEFINDDEQRDKMLVDLDEMEAMIAATLQFARDDVMGEPAQSLDLAALVRACSDAGMESGKVTCILPDELLFTGRPVGLKRMVNNLLGNAQRYAQNVEVELIATDDAISLSVRDDGPGIPEDMLERVFSPFVRVEGSRSRDTGGVGLGLAAVKTIVQAHGGSVVLLNRDGGGLDVRVTLPRRGEA
jgi:signal transduction histidine kinase